MSIDTAKRAIPFWPGRASQIWLADGLAIATAVSLPWSTSATGIFNVLWILAVLPTLDAKTLRRVLATPAAALPVLLWVFAAIGMLWAGAPWNERLGGLGGFHKLLLIPLLFAYFRRSERGSWVVSGFLASETVVLAASWALILFPGLDWRDGHMPGVPVKDYIFQSEAFAVCAFGLFAYVFETWRVGKVPLALVQLGLGLLFVTDIAYVSTGRTTLVIMAGLAILLGFRQFGLKGLMGAAVIGSVVAAALWISSPYLRDRVNSAISEVQTYRTSEAKTSAGLRLEYWKKSLAFVAQAPILGNGTGTIPQLFRLSAEGEAGAAAWATVNPHNQILTVAVQLGLVGTVTLLAMWACHLMLFRGAGFTSWCGLIVVVQNIVGSLFNSHLSDFSQGWFYVLGVGVVGGMVLRQHDKQPLQAADAQGSRS